MAHGVERSEPGVKFVGPSQPGPARDWRDKNSWAGEGNCRSESPALFFPSDGVGVEAARRVCAPCPVKDQCLEYALGNGIDHGVWGGASERERRRIARRRRLSGQ